MTASLEQLDLTGELPDHASQLDHRALAIDRVGIRDLSYPIQVLDRRAKVQHTVARIGLFVDLPKHFKGTHMSRFIEVLNSVRGEMTVRNLPAILAEVQRRLEATNAYLEAEFPYFISKTAPVSGAESLMEYRCRFEASRRGDLSDFVLGVEVPVKSLCPCSKAISDRGAHNQRSVVGVRVRSREFIWIEDLVEAVEKSGSAPLYALLKREDEKFITELAYDNPKFVEDLVRDVVLAIKDMPGVYWLRVTAENQESIHNHSAYAEIEWSEDHDLDAAQLKLVLGGAEDDESPEDFDFGRWLKELRASRNLSQQELAGQLDVSPSFLSRVESGEKSLSADGLARLAEIFGLDPVATQVRAGQLPEALLATIARNPTRFLTLVQRLT